MAYAEGFSGPSALGVILSVEAAVGAALYKVRHERFVPYKVIPDSVEF